MGAVSRSAVWLLVGHKAGDNAQVRALAARLGWPCEEKRIVYRPWELLANRLLGATLAGIDRSGSDALERPWPDLVISSGRRNEPVARWIRQCSGGRTRIVHIGRPWASPAAFDLVIATPQREPSPTASLISGPVSPVTTPMSVMPASRMARMTRKSTGSFATGINCLARV